jgi:hypothetical protein
VNDLPTLVDVTRRSPGPVPLVCPCGGEVRLDGRADPKGETVRYLCEGCGEVRTSLAALVPAPGATVRSA